jgi:DNA-binding NarL/FixJ family response regulator
LRELDEAKTNFFANSSHELRTPLTLLLAPLQGILSGRYGDSIGRNHPVFGIMNRSVDRLKRLADGLLDFIRVDSGSVPSSPVALDAGAFLARYVPEFASVAEQRGISPSFRADDSVTVYADPGMLETAVLNLLSNAVRFTPRGGAIRAAVERRGGNAVLSVSDTGIGIKKEFLPRLFERFSASSEKTRADYSGFGIGLPLTARLVGLMGGNVEVESEVGKGSEFRILLPLHEGTPAPVREPSRERIQSFIPAAAPMAFDPRAGGGEARASILVIDDDGDMLGFLAASLDQRFEAVCVASGEEALRRLGSGVKPEVIVCDVMMPGMDGFQLKQEVDRIEWCAGVPFIFLSAKTDPTTRLDGLSAGAVDYIVKPFAVEELEAKLDSLVSVSHAARARMETRVLRAVRDAGPVRPRMDWRDRVFEFHLAERDLAVLALVMEGLSDKEIASRLRCSPRTVSNRVSSMLRRTGASSRTALIAMLHRSH